ncbi:MAG: hypothetical protein AB1353_08380 [Aquificota bacterium]|jgi:hypothetical protein|uniref:Uncharacterized protein n=1 Tax=Hydrogenobacter sp. TaxID=2152829 RepID=A0A7C2V4R0_9AQUI|nr:hypothetical protein [Aquificaceae bacterium]MDM7267407.1 hypothetical protein [Aquificaceae bacterium]QWK12968.1 MAG: hypothetical protein KNN14_09035 [Aquificota bacterium]HAV39541.1 hypothetical protein [Aquificaceae bacterium]
MDTREEALKLSEEVIKELLAFGTNIDEFYRRFRELRLLEDDLSFQSALLKVEHAFFMLVQSINILKEQLSLLKIASEKKELY